MQTDMPNKSKSLLGVSDLTLVAPIKRGLIPALDSRSYESRLRLLLRALNTLRISSLEADPTPLIVDAIDRIRAIHSFRLAIVAAEPVPQLVLAVAFDGGWEPYLRRIWRDLGPLLDVIFCNCDGYLLAHDHSFAEYATWVRSAQVGTEFFYNASSLTVNDLHYLRENERRRIDRVARPKPVGDAFKQALPALSALYRLTDMYPPPPQGSTDGGCLLRAARHLLRDQLDLLIAASKRQDRRTPTEQAALRWLAGSKPDQPSGGTKAQWNLLKTQGGIIEPYEGMTHGCLLLIGLKDAAAADGLLAHPRSGVISSRDRGRGTRTSPFVNVGFTLQGLQLAGVPDGTLDQLPFEFREGMAARAGILGDLHYNHPTRWKLPERNWPAPTGRRVELSSVHAIVQLACRDTSGGGWQDLVDNNQHPLWVVVQHFERDLGGLGVRILSVQSMQRDVSQGQPSPRGHFGFVDGLSQPHPGPPAAPPAHYSDEVALGDLLLGYENSLGDPPLSGRLWDDSTFLVMRKLRQDVEALTAALPNDAADAKYFKSKLMGRGVDGENLIDGTTDNDFDYDGDPHGIKCPFQSHVRRANPRIPPDTRADIPAVPRILRRGMSYGPLYDGMNGADDRGLIFMAYNASIAEQFEVIQSWLSGGNSSSPDMYSRLTDPFLGVPQDDSPQTFAFKDTRNDDKLRDDERLILPPGRPFVTLEWGIYLFVPSIRALAELQAIAEDVARTDAAPIEDVKKVDRRDRKRAAQVQRGAAVIARLKAVEQRLGFEAAKEQWKIALEDVSSRMSGTSQVLWAAIRQLNDGVIRTPYGVLVCSKALVTEVFDNSGGRYTATGYAERMRKSFGEIYLGMDAGERYSKEADAVNVAIMGVTCRQGFDSAYRHIQGVVASYLPANGGSEEVTVDVKDIVDGVLAAISEEWLGLPDGSDVVTGGWHWRDDGPPTCPGHFHSPSRYMFQPNPGAEASETGQKHGQVLNAAVQRFVASQRSTGLLWCRPRLLRKLFDAIPDDDARLARTLIGVMMGFLPTVDGNLRGVLYEWIKDRSLWDYLTTYLADTDPDRLKAAQEVLEPPLRRTMQLRPVPELTWRIALVRHDLKAVTIEPGDKVVVSIVAAMQEGLLEEEDDIYPVFGGRRGPPQHPIHACPGYEMAMGVLLGTLAGLLESAHLAPTMSPMALRLRRP